MEKMFGNDPTYNHSAAATDNTGTAVYEVTSGGQDRTLPLRFTTIWAKRPAGLEFVSWQSTSIPPKE